MEFANVSVALTTGDWHLLPNGEYSSLYCIEGTGDSTQPPVVQITFIGERMDLVYTKAPSGRTAALLVDGQQVATITTAVAAAVHPLGIL